MNLKENFILNNKCLECDIIITGDTENSSYIKLCNHIKNEHNITNKEYYVKYFMDNEIPLCLCGCGNETSFHKGKFHKYYDDHKNKIKPTEFTINKIKEKLSTRNEIDNLLNKMNINSDIIEKAYHSFINLEKPMSRLSEELFIDFRTLKSYWVKLGLITNKEIFKRFTLKSKSKWLNTINVPNNDVITLLNENVLYIKEYISDKNKVTFDELLSLLDIKINKNYLSWFLKEKLNADETKKIKFIKHSQLEINFLNVLKFYFNNSVQSSFELEGKIFDYKLGKKILIELDGEYWHSKNDAIQNDLVKDKIAKDNNFILIRVNDIEVKNLEFLNELKKIYDEFK